MATKKLPWIWWSIFWFIKSIRPFYIDFRWNGAFPQDISPLSIPPFNDLLISRNASEEIRIDRFRKTWANTCQSLLRIIQEFLHLNMDLNKVTTYSAAVFDRIKSAAKNATVTAVSATVSAVGAVGSLIGNPLTKDFDVGRHVASFGPNLAWKIYEGKKKTTGQVLIPHPFNLLHWKLFL